MRFEILHFNDVYNVEEDESKEICGGAARFTTALKQAKAKSPENTLTVFSGDALSPSFISTTTQGAHMIPILNEMQIDCAVIGNHDFDFGVDNMLRCVEKSNFPWLNSNCYEHATRSLLGNLPPFHIVVKQGIKFGLIGLVEADWVETLAMVDEDEIYVKDFCIEARRLANQLKRQFQCNIVIALTHMRWPNDIRLAERVPEIDLVLGGHDHNAGFEQVTSANGQTRWVIKSGTDFRQFKIVHLDFDPEARRVVSRFSTHPFSEPITRLDLGAL
ncbi:hypothetical protein Ciccas_010862 [Cichlidogyrus casuarinus]|uniref:Calcineurin-like phosphoesterase domain-containing protein n=1 Tax=Cichlidogyrus casuarinus TaxID=1844966 RepID=A0ABD2PTQ4_9PLAT